MQKFAVNLHFSLVTCKARTITLSVSILLHLTKDFGKLTSLKSLLYLLNLKTKLSFFPKQKEM